MKQIADMSAGVNVAAIEELDNLWKDMEREREDSGRCNLEGAGGLNWYLAYQLRETLKRKDVIHEIDCRGGRDPVHPSVLSVSVHGATKSSGNTAP